MQYLFISGTIILISVCSWKLAAYGKCPNLGLFMYTVAKQNIEFTSSYPLADPVISWKQIFEVLFICGR